ncbi:MAG: phosphatidate cytidylyltransferase, partial [Pseudomonadota bacterium]|nr:phosphatidate cytidylyltransferase [Pseudomonadota bacterium]
MLKQRIITALILAPLAILAILFLPLNAFQYVIAGVIALGGYEWANMSGLPKRPHKIAFLFVLLALCVGLIGLVDTDMIWYQGKLFSLYLWILCVSCFLLMVCVSFMLCFV